MNGIPRARRLGVVYPAERGCPGPDGHAHVERFCAFASRRLGDDTVACVDARFEPRHDKSLDEVRYAIGEGGLTHDQVARYPGVFGTDCDTLEAMPADRVARLTELYRSS